MKRNAWFALPLPSPRRLACVAPLVFAAAAAHAADDGVGRGLAATPFNFSDFSAPTLHRGAERMVCQAFCHNAS